MVGPPAIEDPPCDLPVVSTSVSYSRWALFAQPTLAVRRQVACCSRIFA
jgi:hypothetical protein